MPRKKKRIGKINTPDSPVIPKEFKNDAIPIDDLKAEKLAISELKKIKKEILELNKNSKKKDLTKEERLKILQEYATKKVKDNLILEAKLKKATIEYKRKKGLTKKVNPNKTAVDKAKKQVRRIEVAHIEYYWDANSKVYNWIPLHSTPPILVNPKKQELFLLDTPAKYINGKPVFIFIKGIPFAIPMDFFINDLFDNMEKMPNLEKDENGKAKFGRAHLSSTDLFAKYTSIKTIMLFGIKRSVLTSVAMYIFSFILGMMTLYIILSPYIFMGE